MTTVIARSITNLSGNKTFSSNISIPSSCAIRNNGNILLSGSIVGSGGLFHTGSGTTELSNITNYTGSTTIASGTLKLSGSGCLGSGTYNSLMFINGILDYASSVDQVISGTVGTYAYIPTGVGVPTYNNNCKLIINTPSRLSVRSRFGEFGFDGTVEINNGYFTVGNNDNTTYFNGSGSGSIHRVSKIIVNQNGTLELNRGASSSQANINGVIEGVGPINLLGGSFLVAGGGSYSGTLTINPGTTWNTSRFMPNANFVNNGTLTLNVTSSWNTNYIFNTTIDGSTTSFVYLTDYVIGTTIGAANLTAQIQSAGLGNDPSEFVGFVPGRIALVQRGVQSFQTKVNNAIAAGASAVIIYNNTTGLTTPSVTTNIPVIMITQSLGGQLVTSLSTKTVTSRIDTSSTSIPFSNAVSGNGTIIKSGDVPLIMSIGSAYTGIISITGGALRTGNAFNGTASIRPSGSTGAFEIVGNITIPNPFSLSGTGISSAGAIRNISGNNTISGPVSLTAASRINSDTGTLTLDSTGTLTGTFGLTLGGAGNIVVNRAIATTTGTLTKDGAGTVVLSAANTYTGVTTLNGGTTIFASISSLYNGNTASWTRTNIIVNSGATFALAVGNSTIAGITPFSSANVSTILTNLLTSINNNGLRSGSFVGFDTTNSLESVGTSPFQTVTNQFTFAGNITNSAGTGAGAVGVMKLGTGTLVLSGTGNTYTGGTVINGGTLKAGNANCFGTGTITLNAGATLDLAGFTVSNTIVNNGGTIIN